MLCRLNVDPRDVYDRKKRRAIGRVQRNPAVKETEGHRTGPAKPSSERNGGPWDGSSETQQWKKRRAIGRVQRNPAVKETEDHRPLSRRLDRCDRVIQNESKEPFGGNVYYVTMQITFLTHKFRNGERNLHCDVVHITTKWVSSLTLDCNGFFAIKAYRTGPSKPSSERNGGP